MSLITADWGVKVFLLHMAFSFTAGGESIRLLFRFPSPRRPWSPHHSRCKSPLYSIYCHQTGLHHRVQARTCAFSQRFLLPLLYCTLKIAPLRSQNFFIIINMLFSFILLVCLQHQFWVFFQNIWWVAALMQFVTMCAALMLVFVLLSITSSKIWRSHLTFSIKSKIRALHNMSNMIKRHRHVKLMIICSCACIEPWNMAK